MHRYENDADNRQMLLRHKHLHLNGFERGLWGIQFGHKAESQTGSSPNPAEDSLSMPNAERRVHPGLKLKSKSGEVRDGFPWCREHFIDPFRFWVTYPHARLSKIRGRYWGGSVGAGWLDES